MAAHLREYHRKEKLDKAESELFAQMLSILAIQMVPFIERCISIIFPFEQLQKAYGLSQTDTLKLKESMRLDYKNLLECVVDLIPAPPVQVVNPVIFEEEKVESVESVKPETTSDTHIPDNQVEEVTTTTTIFEVGPSEDTELHEDKTNARIKSDEEVNKLEDIQKQENLEDQKLD